MLDPFPIPPPESFRLYQAITRVANSFNLPTLPLHAHEVLFALVFYDFVAQTLGPFVSARLFPQTYPKLNDRTKINWAVHVVSFVQSIIINALSLYVILYDEERKGWRGDENWEKRIWGYTGLTGLTQSFALGYFLWDLYMSSRYLHIFGLGDLAHAICCCVMFTVGFVRLFSINILMHRLISSQRPFVHFYCPVFLLHELSSPFLNIHWFCDKLGLTGSTFQAANGVLLTATFFGCRLVWGTHGSIAVGRDVYRAVTTGYTTPQYLGDKIAQSPSFGDMNDPIGQTTAFMKVRYLPLWLGASYLIVNLLLTLLNYYWFFQMIQAIRKRFDPPLGTKGVGEDKKNRLSETDQKKRK